jgi:tripartite-type tricarboxylate transporter receptor subunit TctC
MTRRGLLALSLAGGLAAAAMPAQAQTQAQEVFPIPGKPIRIVLPFPPGTGSDASARVVAKLMTEALGGHPVVVDNKPGASTIIGAQEVARAPADGHTLLYTIVVTHTQNPHLYSKLPYDPVKDFTPLTQVMKSATVLVAPNNAPFNTIAEMVAYAKAHPGKLSYASYSPGSTSHLNAELLKMRTGIDMLHVPYKGTTDATRALIAGDVQAYFDGTASATALIQAGRVKGLGAAQPRRVAALPELPTIAEQGIAGLDFVGWQGFFGPGNMAPATAEKIAALLSRVVRSPEMLQLIAAQGNEPSGISGAEFDAIVKNDSAHWGAIVRAVKLKLD